MTDNDANKDDDFMKDARVQTRDPYFRALTATTTRSTTAVSAIPELSIALPIGQWESTYKIYHSSAVNTTGIRLTLVAAGGLAATTTFFAFLQSNTAGATPLYQTQTVLGTGVFLTTAVTTANIPQYTIVRCIIGVTTAGTLELHAGSEVAATCSYLLRTNAQALLQS